MSSKSVFVVVDCETTGLDETECQLIEVGITLADRDLNPVDSLSFVINPSKKINWAEVHQSVLEMHSNNGLREIVDRNGGVRLSHAQDALIDFIMGNDLEDRPMMGSSIQFDRRWLTAKMPALESIFHYRNIDFSSVNELARELNPRIFAHRPDKPGMHRVDPDCKDTLELARYYADNFFFVSE